MLMSFRPLLSLTPFALTSVLFPAPAHANQLVYIPLAQPCRLLDTRTSSGGAGPLTAAHGAYLFGASAGDIAAQNGNSAGCGIPQGVDAISVNMNLLNATASGNITTWSGAAGPTAPNIGTAVYNPTVTSPAAGQVQYNTGYTSVPVGNPSIVHDLLASDPGGFYLQVANGQVDMTINVVGYWLPISWYENRSGTYANALGLSTSASGSYSTAMGTFTTAGGTASTAMGSNSKANGDFSTAMGYGVVAAGDYATAMGIGTTASGKASTAMGNDTVASGDYSVAMGDSSNASAPKSIAIGYKAISNGALSTAIGNNVSSDGHFGSFIYGDSVHTGVGKNFADDQFMVLAYGGVVFYTGEDPTTHLPASGAALPHGSGTWTSISDRNAKTAVQPVDPHEVLKKVVALPLNTWQYKAQEAKYRHMGPMAQDFYAAFQLGESDKGIDTVDADGVALAAIQGLNTELSEKNQQIAALDGEVVSLRSEMMAQAKGKDAEIAVLHAELSAQKQRVATLESLAGDVAHLKAQFATFRQTSPAPVTVALTQP